MKALNAIIKCILALAILYVIYKLVPFVLVFIMEIID